MRTPRHVTVGAFDQHARAGSEPRQPMRAVTHDTRGDRQAAAPGVSGEREGVPACPPAAVEKPPDEELPGARTQAVECASAHPYDDAARPVVLDRRDADAVAHGSPQRHADTEDHHGSGGQRPQSPPVHTHPGVRGEVRPRPEHVRDREADAEVGVQVQQVPGLVAQTPPRAADARDDDENQQERAGGGEQHAGVVPREIPRLGEERHPRLLRVAHDEEDDVREHQPERPEPGDAVHARDRIAPDAAFEQRHPGHEQYLVEKEIRRCEAGETPEGVRRLGPAAEDRLHSPARHPQGCDREAREPDERHGRGMPRCIERGRRDGTSWSSGSSGSSGRGAGGCGHEIGNVNGHAKSVRCGLPDDAKNSRFTCFS